QEHQLRARRVAAVSRFLIEEQVNPAKHGAADVVYNGAESFGPPPDPARVAAFRTSLGFSPDTEVVAYFGRIERNTYKGVEDLVGIATELRQRRPRARLLMVGFSDEVSAAHFREIPGVDVHPNVPEESMPLYFSAADVVVSASRWEGFNMPLAE